LHFRPRKATLFLLDPLREPLSMLISLKRATRSWANLVWLFAFVFAIAPGICKALAIPVGAFAGFVVHAHAHAEPGHVHYGHHHHGHDHGHQHEGNAAANGPAPDHGESHVHVHYDACCPSVVTPVLNSGAIEHRATETFATPIALPKQGESPDNLLRPPIALSLL
jgi:hypothetical protein